MEQRWAHEVAEEPTLNLLRELGDQEATVFGITGLLKDLAGMCPIDLSDPRVELEAKNDFVVKVLNESGATVDERYEPLFTSTLERLGLERKIAIKAAEAEVDDDKKPEKAPKAVQKDAGTESAAAKVAVATSVEKPKPAAGGRPQPVHTDFPPMSQVAANEQLPNITSAKNRQAEVSTELNVVPERAQGVRKHISHDVDPTAVAAFHAEKLLPEPVVVDTQDVVFGFVAQRDANVEVAQVPRTARKDETLTMEAPTATTERVAEPLHVPHMVEALLAEPVMAQLEEAAVQENDSPDNAPSVQEPSAAERPVPPFSARVRVLAAEVVAPERQEHVQVLIAKVYELAEATFVQTTGMDEVGSRPAMITMPEGEPLPETLEATEQELVCMVARLLQELGEPEPTPEQIERFIALVRSELLAEAPEVQTGKPAYDFLHERLLEPLAATSALVLSQLLSQLLGRAALGQAVGTQA